jgi:TRAP-type C4-dicarboxylate transport system substrate-binding protein
MRILKTAAVVIAAGLALGPGVRAQETVPLTVIDAYAPTSLWVRVFIDHFIPMVDERLAAAGRYEVDWNLAFGGTVAKTGGVLEALQYGLADIGIITTPFHPDKVPFFNISYVTPLVTADVGLVARTVNELVERYPELTEQWTSYRQVFLTAAGSIDTYQLLLASPIESLNDVAGRKIAGVGANLRYVQGLGAAAVSSNLGDFYNNVATGLTDGMIVWPEAAVAYKLYEVAPFMIDAQLGAVTSKVITVNERTWRLLPDEVRRTLAETAIDYRDALARETDRRSELSRREFEAHGGRIVGLTAEQRAEWAASLPNMAQEWAEDLERRGLPGRQILADYMDIMRANNQPIVRHWDRE